MAPRNCQPAPPMWTQPAETKSDTTESGNRWLAIAVQKVKRDDLVQMMQFGYEKSKWREVMPIEPVTVSFSPSGEPECSGVAILSWRWDTQTKGQESRNLLAAIAQAVNDGYSHLLADVVSIDQTTKDPSALLRRVADFSALYKDLPVIAAYDMEGPGCRLMDTMRRPWITNEVNLFRDNNTCITYAGHSPRGGAHYTKDLWAHGPDWGYWGEGSGLERSDEHRKYRFAEDLDQVWSTGFTTTLIRMLEGTIDMQDISDLRFIMPQYAPVLTLAHDNMPRADYLMTAALLSMVGVRQPSTVNDDDRPYTFLKDDMFKWYGFREREPVRPMPFGGAPRYFELTLGNIVVGRWDEHGTYSVRDTFTLEWITFQAEGAAEMAICEALGLTKGSRALAAYQAERDEMQRRATPLRRRRCTFPKVKIVKLDLQTGDTVSSGVF